MGQLCYKWFENAHKDVEPSCLLQFGPRAPTITHIHMIMRHERLLVPATRVFGVLHHCALTIALTIGLKLEGLPRHPN